MNNDSLQNSKEQFIKDLDAYFYGPNFWQTGLHHQLKDVTVEQALWKPSPERHCIWEIVRHINSWKWFSLEIFKGKKVESMKELDWQSLPDVTDPEHSGWKKDFEQLTKDHEELKQLVMNAEESFFISQSDLSKYVREIIYHDCYHCGQIGLLRVMQGLKPV